MSALYLKCLTFLFKLAAHNCEYLKNFASTLRSPFLLTLSARAPLPQDPSY